MSNLPANKQPKLTRLQREFITNLLANPKDKAGAMKAAGCKAKDPGVRAAQELRKPHVRAELLRLSQDHFSLEGVLLAQRRIVDLIDNSRSDKVKLEASQDVLDRHADTARHVNGGSQVHITLDFTEPSQDERAVDGTHVTLEHDPDGG